VSRKGEAVSVVRRTVEGMIETPTERLLGIQRVQRAGSILLVLGVVALLGGLWLLTTTHAGPLAGIALAFALIGAGIDRRLTARRRRQRFDIELEYELLSRPSLTSNP
jgi:membrane-bound ClpP family serine protease